MNRSCFAVLLLSSSINLALAQSISPATTPTHAPAPQMPASMPEALRQQLLDNKPIRVNGKEIPRKEIEQAYAQLKASGQQDTPAARLVVRQELLTKELFRQAAAAQGLDKSVEVARAMEEAKTNAMLALFVERNLHVPPATEAQMHAEYDKLVSNMGPKEYKVRLIAVPDAATAETLRAQAVAKQQRFEELARQYSKHPSAARGGELDWQSFKLPLTQGQTNGVEFNMAQAMTTLQPGEISPVLKTPNAWVILEMEVARETAIPPFDKTAPALKRLVEKKAKEQAVVTLVKDLVTKAKIEQ